MYLRHIALATLLLFGSFAAAGCAQKENLDFPTCDVEEVPAQPLYPEPGASNVPVDAGVLILAGSNETTRLITMPAQTIVKTRPTALPSPLPSPEATPQFNQETAYAVAIPTLAPETTYSIESYNGGCSPGYVTTASFTTQ